MDGFSDPMIDNKDSKKRYRADQLLEEKIAKYDSEGKTDLAEQLQLEMDTALLKMMTFARLKELIIEHEIIDPSMAAKLDRCAPV